MKKKQFIASMLLAMKISFVQILLAGIFTLALYASPSTAQDILKKQVSISVKQAEICSVISLIQKQTGIRFLYSQEGIEGSRKIKLHVASATVGQVLEDIFKPLKIGYNVLDDQILLFRIYSPPVNELTEVTATPVISTAPDINGKITDDKGQPLEGVTILVKGTNNGVKSDANGNFFINTAPNSTLIISYVGYETTEVRLGNQATISVQLKPSIAVGDQIIVVGYGTQRKISLTGAVGTVKGDELTKRTVSNVQQALQGQVAGLTILDQGAAPGKTNMVMRIRGITTLGANEPLVIVDGIEQRLNDINPEDIESVSVLKDASSSAIYGSRAANGVVLITTKRAKAGKVSVSYSGYYALQKTNNNPVHMGLEDYMRLQNRAWVNSTGTPIFKEEYIKEYVNATDRLKYPLPNTWYDAVLHTAPQINNSISVSGGNEMIKALLSVRYQDQEGIIANSGSKISEVRLNTDYRVSAKINIATDVNYRYNNILAPLNEGLVFNDMLQTSQWTVPKYPDGTYGISSDGKNPLVRSEIEGTARTGEEYLTGNIKGDWEIIEGLKFTTQLGARISLTKQKNYQNSFEIRDYYNPSIVTRSQPLNSLTEIRNDVREFTINNLLNYSTILGSHSINVLAGYSQIENKGTLLNAFRQGFYSNDIRSIGQGANDGTKNNGGNEYSWGLRSYFGRLNYSFQNKYLFEANSRYDGSSRFLGANRYSFFPSFSAGWRISQEKFWNGLNHHVNEFKLRGSWGKTGNQAVDLYSYLATLSLTTYSFNGTAAPGYTQQRMANQNLTWETTTQSNIGLDAQFLNNKFSISVDYYNKKTDDILLLLPVPGTLGLLPAPQNAGRMDNKGWEFLIGAHHTFGQIGFNANLNFNINKNTVVDLAGTGPYITGGNETRYITGIGYPINSFWGYKTEGLFQTKDDIKNYPNMRPGIEPGDVKFVDLNKDGKITAADMTFLGRSYPRYTFGSNLNFTYKNFALNMLFQGVAGAKTRIGGAIVEMGIWGGFTHELIANNYWTPENPNARFPRPLKYDLRNIVMSDRDLMNGAYLRLKNIQLLYQIPSFLTSKAGIERMSVYVSGTNLLTFAELNEWNVDPETVPGGRTQAYPQTSLYTFGVNIQL
ncbi:MAG: TonB-dependent receptor [Chitinophagaceae bacterium]